MSARGKVVPLVSLRRIVMLASRLEVHQRSMVVYLVMLVCLRTKFSKSSSKLSAYAVTHSQSSFPSTAGHHADGFGHTCTERPNMEAHSSDV